MDRASKYDAYDSAGNRVHTAGTSETTPHTTFAGLIAGADDAAAARDVISAQKLHMFDVTEDPYLATGDGSTNDTTAIQAAIDAAEAAGGGVVYFPEGTYMIARTAGTNDVWGIKVDSDNVTLKGETGSILDRHTPGISFTTPTNYSTSFPIVFIGVADSDVAASTDNVVIEGLQFLGEDARHAQSAATVHDG